MSIRFHDSFIVAKKVLAATNKIMPKKLQRDCVVETYSNCREQGLSIWCWKDFDKHIVNKKIKAHIMRVSFSENRNSDDIVVYAGKDNFSMQGNVPDDTAYKCAHYFRYDKVQEAAQFIVTFLS